MKLEVNAAYDSEVSYFVVSQFGGHEQLCKKSESRDMFSVKSNTKLLKTNYYTHWSWWVSLMKHIITTLWRRILYVFNTMDVTGRANTGEAHRASNLTPPFLRALRDIWFTECSVFFVVCSELLFFVKPYGVVWLSSVYDLLNFRFCSPLKKKFHKGIKEFDISFGVTEHALIIKCQKSEIEIPCLIY